MGRRASHFGGASLYWPKPNTDWSLNNRLDCSNTLKELYPLFKSIISKYIDIDYALNIGFEKTIEYLIDNLNQKEIDDIKQFFKDNNEIYTKLMISAPNLSIKEMELAKEHYKTYKKTFHC